MRIDGRNEDELRPIQILREFTKKAHGSVLCEFGETRVLCTASIEPEVPVFLKGKKQGWLTAEYSMLPSSTVPRTTRNSGGKIDGRSQEIQRLIGRSLRCILDLKALGEKTVWIDCDVLQADGGTRTAAITGAYVALMDALQKFHQKEPFLSFPIKTEIAAVSVGIVQGRPLLDLCQVEDNQADVDMNLVMTGTLGFVEIQGTGEQKSFSSEELQELLRLGKKGISALIERQKQALGASL
ncbi:MAG: ribonuclease PH [Planctomycetota bacterium]